VIDHSATGVDKWLRYGPLFCWFLVAALVKAAYIPLSEEPGLVKRFREEYLTYKRNVPRWVPRWTPWNDEFRKQS